MMQIALVLMSIALILAILSWLSARNRLNATQSELVRMQELLKESMALTERNLETISVYQRIVKQYEVIEGVEQ